MNTQTVKFHKHAEDAPVQCRAPSIPMLKLSPVLACQSPCLCFLMTDPALTESQAVQLQPVPVHNHTCVLSVFSNANDLLLTSMLTSSTAIVCQNPASAFCWLAVLWHSHRQAIFSQLQSCKQPCWTTAQSHTMDSAWLQVCTTAALILMLKLSPVLVANLPASAFYWLAPSKITGNPASANSNAANSPAGPLHSYTKSGSLL